MLAADSFTAELAPRAKFEGDTTEAVTGYDTTGIRWGFKYSGWVVALYQGGQLVALKASTPSWERPDRVGDLKVSAFYGSDLSVREGLRLR